MVLNPSRQTLFTSVKQIDQINRIDLSREMPNFLLSHRDKTDQIDEKDKIRKHKSQYLSLTP